MRGKSRLKATLLLLPPDGWEAEGWIAPLVEEIRVGGVRPDLSLRRLGEGSKAFEKSLRGCCGPGGDDVVLTVGRSGHRAGDFVPDVTRAVLDRSLPGIEERMYLSAPRKPEDLLFRGAAGIRGGTVVVNLPARRGRVRSILRMLAPVLGHALDKAAGDPAECARP